MPLNPAPGSARLSIAPMMDWTDRHCRYFHRQLSRHALLYTEMLTAGAVIHGPRDRLLGFDPAEHPVALQLGGSDPADLAEAARIGAGVGYDEINLNCGCPSDRVQSGCFGAVMMEDPALVTDCLKAMQDAVDLPVTVKCRIGVDDQDPATALPAFLDAFTRAGVSRVIVHARKAWLKGLSPKENRDVPPLDYPLVLSMKRAFPHLHLSVNGGIASLDQAQALLDSGIDGVMIGRAAYHEPWDILSDADRRFFGGMPGPDPWAVADAMRPYIAAHLRRWRASQSDHPPHARPVPRPPRRAALAAHPVRGGGRGHACDPRPRPRRRHARRRLGPGCDRPRQHHNRQPCRNHGAERNRPQHRQRRAVEERPGQDRHHPARSASGACRQGTRPSPAMSPWSSSAMTITVGITSPRKAFPRNSPAITTGSDVNPAATSASVVSMQTAKPSVATRTTARAPNRCPSPAAACEAAKNPMALTAKASEKPVGDRPNCPV